MAGRVVILVFMVFFIIVCVGMAESKGHRRHQESKHEKHKSAKNDESSSDSDGDEKHKDVSLSHSDSHESKRKKRRDNREQSSDSSSAPSDDSKDSSDESHSSDDEGNKRPKKMIESRGKGRGKGKSRGKGRGHGSSPKHHSNKLNKHKKRKLKDFPKKLSQKYQEIKRKIKPQSVEKPSKKRKPKKRGKIQVEKDNDPEEFKIYKRLSLVLDDAIENGRRNRKSARRSARVYDTMIKEWNEASEKAFSLKKKLNDVVQEIDKNQGASDQNDAKKKIIMQAITENEAYMKDKLKNLESIMEKMNRLKHINKGADQKFHRIMVETSKSAAVLAQKIEVMQKTKNDTVVNK